MGLAYNRRPTQSLAESVADGLAHFNLGWREDIKTEGAGETGPIASNATEEGRAGNRRVEIWSPPEKSWKDC